MPESNGENTGTVTVGVGSPPPPPPPVPPPVSASAPRPIIVVPGQLNAAWQIMMAVVWTAAFFAFSAVWKTSVELGIATWWLGPRSDEEPIVLRIMPFVVCVVMAMVAIFNVRRAAALSGVASVLVALIAVFDIDRSGGLAAIEFAIAALVLLVSIGSLSGTARRAPATPSSS